MAEKRAGKSGFARDAQDKVDSKFDADQAAQVMAWIKSYVPEVTCADGTMANVYETLQDGFVLRRLMYELKNQHSPGSGGKAPTKKKATFQQMEEINLFIQAASKPPFSVDNSELIQTVDLYEKGNLPGVVNCLSALGRKCSGLGLRGFGPKEATANKRDFTDEQLKAGQNIIGLQMGSNKGANQSGINMGKGRSIMD